MRERRLFAALCDDRGRRTGRQEIQASVAEGVSRIRGGLRVPIMHNLISADVSPLTICAVTVVASAAGGFLPVSALEPVLVGIAAVARPTMILPVVALATVTQMASKTALYLASRKANHALSPRKRAFLDRMRIRLDGRRWLQMLMVLASAIFGLPPFYMVTVASGAIGLPLRDYLVAGTLGRATRFTILMMLPQLFAAAHR